MKLILLYKNGESKYIHDSNDISKYIDDNVKYVLLNVEIDGSSRYVPIKAKYIITKLDRCTIKYSIGSISNFVDMVYGNAEEEADIIKFINNKLVVDTIEKFYSYLFSFSNIDFYNMLSGRMEFTGLPPMDIYELVIDISSDKYDNKYVIVKKGSDESDAYNAFELLFLDNYTKICKDKFHLFEVAADLNNNNKVLVFNKNKSWGIHHVKNAEEPTMFKNAKYFTIIDSTCGSIFMITPLEYSIFDQITHINFKNIILDTDLFNTEAKGSINRLIELYDDVAIDYFGVIEMDFGKPISGLITFVSLITIIVAIHKLFCRAFYNGDLPNMTSASQLYIDINDAGSYTLNYTENDMKEFNVTSFLHEFIKIKKGRQ